MLDLKLFQTSSDIQSVENETCDFEVGFVASDIDVEIDECIHDVSKLNYSHPIKSNSTSEENEEINFDEFNYSTQYDLTKGSPFEKLDIVIDGNQITRFSCCNHKLNLALRHAFQLHSEFLNILCLLNKSNAHIRNTIALNKVCQKN